jgi:dTDP-4-amino-4,6-dideoxygalactose transaminase
LQVRHDDNRADRLLQKRYLKEIAAVMETFSGLNDYGRYTELFEKEYAKYAGTKYAFAVESGTAALHLSLLASGTGKHGSVIIPSLTYISTALSVCHAGAEPALAGISGLTLDASRVEKAIKKNTKAIMPVHLFGHICDMEALSGIAEKHGLLIIEDACQAQGCSYRGRKAGSFGELNAFSLDFHKPVSSFGGRGGVITFNEAKYREILESYTKEAQGKKELTALPIRFRAPSLPDLATAMVKLKYAGHIESSRKETKKIYDTRLGGIAQVKIFKGKPGTVSIPQPYVILAEDRDSLFRHLKEREVTCEPPYLPIHMTQAFSHLGYRKGDFPDAERYHEKALHLPCFSFMKKEEAGYVADVIKEFY